MSGVSNNSCCCLAAEADTHATGASIRGSASLSHRDILTFSTSQLLVFYGFHELDVRKLQLLQLQVLISGTNQWDKLSVSLRLHPRELQTQ